MFSIAAINDTDTGGKWEPLAPTKEAQEFHLSQTYHEGLLKLQDKDYVKARELLESVLKDPIISSAQAGNIPNDRHLLQLRFLSLKNLATVFLEQGPMHYESALHCYLQAVELDEKDSVVWNHLGTLSCKMGLLSTSRWAFEQGLQCSPNNWNCMAKLLEVLIAIGDEVACLSVANLILRHWPSHSRALHVKKTIEDVESMIGQPFSPRGIDKLEPKHARLKFPAKRKSADSEFINSNKCKRHKQTIRLQLAGATWSALLNAIHGIFLPSAGKDSEPEVSDDYDNTRNEKLQNSSGKELSGDAATDYRSLVIQRNENMDSFICTKIDIHLPELSDIVIDPAKSKEQGLYPVGGCAVLGSCDAEKTTTAKEKDISSDREHPQERRSTRLERLRSRKSGKEDSEASAKDQANIVFQILEPFVLTRLRVVEPACTVVSEGTNAAPVTYASDLEHNDILQFISKISENSGAHHIVHMLLEYVAHKDIPFQDSFVKFLELEKLNRNWGKDRSPLCSLFLAELYYDQGSWFSNRSKQLEYLSETSYHLCKVIELVSYNCPDDSFGTNGHFSSMQTAMAMNDANGTLSLLNDRAEKGSTLFSDNSQTVGETTSDFISEEKQEHCSTLSDNDAFWVRFFWLSGRLSLFQECKSKALNEFCICLTLLRNNKKLEEASDFVFLPHCKLTRLVTIDRVLHQINLLKLDSLLGKTSEDMMEKGMYMECINMFSPLLSTKDVYLDSMFRPLKEKERTMSVELSALNLLISACEKVEPLDIKVYLNCRRRKLQVLTVAAGMGNSLGLLKDKCLELESCNSFEMDYTEQMKKEMKILVSEEVKDISRSATQVKNFIDQVDFNLQDSFGSVACVVADVQLLLLTVMCSAIRTILSQKFSGSVIPSQTDQLETWCLVDAAIAFCKLQHLDSSVSIKTQVDLIVAVHDLLAEFGLCCAGRDNKGEEGTFLKFAIKHLLSLDVKLKQLSGANGQDKVTCSHKHTEEIVVSDSNASCEEGEEHEGALDAEKKSKLDSSGHSSIVGDDSSSLPDEEIEEVELSIDTALDQSFFCLYGLKINLDSSSEEEPTIHKNTSRGEYQTKEQCADVFQYLLPYAKALSRTGLVKLRRVLRAIRKHFPQPPEEVLSENAIDKFLDGPDLWEDKLREVPGLTGGRELITSILSNARIFEMTKKSSVVSSEQYLDVYGNLYFFIAQAEEISASDKYAGFVLKREGEEFVEQSANLFKYDLLYNPFRFESWQKLANIYDEEVDLLLNDGSKHINVLDWRKNTSLHRRVDSGRRRSRRCLLMSLALASTPSQQSQIHELLALVYYDSLQNVVPFYDQRSILPTKDSTWMTFCQNSMEHFEKAFTLKCEWLHAFYLGKLCEKMGQSPSKALSYFKQAASLNPSAVDPVYRMHASRIKLLYSRGRDLDTLQVVAAHAYSESARETIIDMFNWTSEDLTQLSLDMNYVPSQDDLKEKKNIDPKLLDKAWHILYDDCLIALGICVEGELKHFHKGRYMLAKGLYKRGESGDMERAKEELSFCFKSSRSSFTVNMWEIDGMARKGRKKNPSLVGNKKCLELSLSESSRKFITCVRKYLLFYLNLLEKTGDFWTLERAYVYLKTDKRFALCVGDIIPVALGRYIQVLVSSVRNIEMHNATNSSTSIEQLLEKLFNIFMDHVTLWTDVISLPELRSPDVSESNIYSYIHQYIHLLESEIRLDALEGINEKIRKRFKNPKLTNNNIAKICKHASLAWCRSITIKLALITPLPDSGEPNDKLMSLENTLLLFVDLQPDELLLSQSEGAFQSKGLDMNWFDALYKIKNIQIRQTSEENMEAAVALMKCTYNFYRESSCGTFPSGIKLYTTSLSQSTVEGQQRQVNEVIDTLDLSIPRKLLLWAYNLVFGRYSNISTVVKYCEEARARMKRGASASTASQVNAPAANVTQSASGAGREKMDGSEHVDAEDTSLLSSASAASNAEETGRNEAQKSAAASSQLHRCNSSKLAENSEG